MSVIQRIRNAQTILALIIATVFIVPFQVVFFYVALIVSVNPMKNTVNFVPHGIPFLLGYFVLTIIYCIVSSLLFDPKRIVSPVNVQILTWIVISIIQFFNSYYILGLTFFSPTYQQVILTFGNWAWEMFVILIILVFVGFGQLFIVRWVVGPNLIGLTRKSYSIDSDCETVDKIIRGLTDFRKSIVEDKVVYKLPLGVVDQVLLVLGPDPRNDHQSILATVAYHNGLYSIEESDYVSKRMESTIFELMGRLIANDPSLEIIEIKEELFDPPSTLAYRLALKPTQTKFKVAGRLIERIPRFYKVFMLLTSILLIMVNVAFWIPPHNIDFNTYVSTTVFLFFALFAEAGIPLREEIRDQLFKKKD